MAKNFAKDVAQSIAMDYAKEELKDGFRSKPNSFTKPAQHSSGEGYKVPVNWNANSNMSPMAQTFHTAMQKRSL
ncbi:hypothetical protein PRIPAC_76797 [Pristionchus pacificus]|uniref:Uncharacterized protein n=1 Tax=Pristionchus pacificus TaxID=54126 RepID=A0A454XXK6_PRIPA|nr:hypothetical protein PRIPAC_76797 [Pristionchus pacificus]|eukprot:PDM79919.1 hypothetical protein PRIPAC_32498 [Pristionchus pacificus]